MAQQVHFWPAWGAWLAWLAWLVEVEAEAEVLEQVAAVVVSSVAS
jgi:hypothetical protein